MGWQRIFYGGKKERDPNQFDLFSDPAEQAAKVDAADDVPQKRRTKSQRYFLQPYTAPSNGTCHGAYDACHKGGEVIEGDPMIRAIPMPGTPGPHFFFHEGQCADEGIKKIDGDAERAIRNR